MINHKSIPSDWNQAKDLTAFADHLGVPDVLWTLLLEELSSQYGRLSMNVTEILKFLMDEHSELVQHNARVAPLTFMEKLAWIEAIFSQTSCSDETIKKVRSAVDQCRAVEVEQVRLSVHYAAISPDQRWFLPFVNLHKKIGTAMVKLNRAIKVRHPDFPKSTRRSLKEILGGDED